MKLLNIGLMIDSLRHGFQLAMEKICTEYRELNCFSPNFNEQALNVTNEFKPDLIFLHIQTPNILNLEVAKKMAQSSFVMQWNGDIRNETPSWGIELGKIIQLTTYSNMRDVYNTREHGIKSDFLQIGIETERYNKWGEEFAVPEIVFMANNYNGIYPLSKERAEIANVLRQQFGSRFGLYGQGWGISNGNLMSDQKLESKYYNNSKIAISHNHFSEERFTSDRTFRAMASGSMVLSHNYPAISRDFEIGKHLDVYQNMSDLVAKCHYYLDNENERQVISENGYKYCHQNFTYDNMAKEILKLYNKYK